MKINRRFAVLLLAWSGLTATRALAQTCNQISPLVYRQAASTSTTDVEKRTATETVSGTSFTYGGYTSTATGTTTNDIFQLTTDQQDANLDARMLVWRQNNTNESLRGTNNAEVDLTSGYGAQVTLTFTREVSNLSFVVQDIDRSIGGNGGSNFTDELALYALNAAGTRVDLTGANIGYGAAGTGTSSTFNAFIDNITINGLTQDAVRGTTLNGGVGNNPSRAGNVTINFSSPVKSVRLTFRNLSSRVDVATNGVPLRLQTIGIEQITWCAQADVATTITGPATAAIGSTVTYVATIANNGEDQVASVQPTVQLPTGLTNVMGGTYVPATGLLTLTPITNLAANASVTRNITFTMPNAAVTGVVSVPTTGNGSTSAGSSAPDPALANNNGSLANASVTTTPPYSISGTVFEDINYGGGAGRSIATANAVTANSAVGVGAAGTAATVELYNATTGAFIASTTTSITAGSLGQYTFNNLPGGTSYITRVVNSTVRSTRTGSTPDLIGVQTFNGATNRVGGEFPSRVDAAANTSNANLNTLTPATGTTAAQSLATVAIGTANVPNINFGFNFDVVVNTNDAGQGSLRQFITNANALSDEALLAQSGSYTNQQDLAAGSTAAGRAPVALPTGIETSIFMIPAAALTATNGVAVITPASVLPQILGGNLAINGATQTFNIGNTNDVLLGAGGTVGTAGTALSRLNGPEVQIVGARTGTGIEVRSANNVTIRGISIYGYATQIGVAADIINTVIEQDVIGASARSFTDPGAGVRGTDQGIFLYNSDNSTVRNNLIGYNGGMGIWLYGDGNGANDNLITNNELRGNAQEVLVGNYPTEGRVFDGLELQGKSTRNNVSGNLITESLGHGIDSFGNDVGGNMVTGNTISNNGQGIVTSTGVEGSGLRVFGATTVTTISNNVITGNNGSGVLVLGSANQVTISRNSTSGNTRLGIDLLSTAETNLNSTTAGTIFWNGNTGANSNVTLNDSGDGDTGGNGLLNFPVLTTATLDGTNLIVSGFARPGALVELFLATTLTTDPTNSNRNFGQGLSYLASRTEGNNADDTNTGAAGTYGPAAVNGINQGTDTTTPFTFTIPLNTLTGAQVTALQSGTAVLTSTATLANSTSEFSGNLTVAADVTTALTGPATVSPGQPTGIYTATFTNEGPASAAGVTRKVTLPAGATNVVLPAGATLSGSVIDFDGGTPTTLANGATSSFSFSFTPVATATGTQTVTSNVTTVTPQGADRAPNSSTINATVPTTANVATTLAATTATAAAGTLSTATSAPQFTVTFSNSGPALAAGVAASVQLPKNLTGVTSTNNTGGVYTPSTGILTFPNITSIGSGVTAVTSVISFNAPATGPVVATSAISTTTNEANQTANNTASASIIITPAFDLTTTLSGPVSAVAGNPVMLSVTTTNNGPSAAANALQTVQLVSGLTNVYVSNGGYYNPTTGAQNITLNGLSYSVPAGGVVFPALNSLPSGQTVANTITFVQPATAFAPTALVTPNTASTATAAGDTNTGNNTANLNGGAAGTTLALGTPVAGTANAYTKITSSVASTTVGGPVTLTVTTGNSGPNQATALTQTVEILPGFTGATLQINGSTGTLNAATQLIEYSTTNGTTTYSPATGLVSFPAIPNGNTGSTSGTSVSNTLSFNAPASTGSNGQLLAMAAVRTTNTDAVPADNVSSVAVTLLQSTDVVTSLVGPATASAGQPVQYTATFVNNGPMAATGVTETVQLPAGLGTVTITDGAGASVLGATYNATTGLVTFPTQNLDPNGTAQVYKLTFAAPTQDFTPRSTVASTSLDGTVTNNSSPVTTAIAAVADLATTVSGPTTAVVGNAVTYAVNTTNNGPSAAASTVTTLQLANTFTATTIQVNGVAGTQNANIITFGTNGPAYNTTTGLLTFPTIASLASGATASNYVTFVMPNPTGGQNTGVSSVSTTTTELIASNNSASVATSVAPTTAAIADLTANVTAAASATANSVVSFTATYGNIGTNAATSVVPTLQLAPGLTTTTLKVATQTGMLSGNIITFGTNGPTYNTTTGLLTFPTIANQTNDAAGNVTYIVDVTAPGTGPLVATAITTSNTSEPNTAAAQINNAKSASVTINALFDEVASLSGPASALPGTSVTYTATATNNGPSATANATTQTVNVPAGQVPTNISAGGSYVSANNTITWTIPAGQAPGASGAVANSFTLVQPAGGALVTTSVSASGESNTDNNTANLNGAATPTATTVANQPPLAFAVVNSRQTPTNATTNNPMGNTAGNNPATPNGLLITSLAASDPENALNTTAPYTILTIPTTAQGVLYYNNNGVSTAITGVQNLTTAQAGSLTFKPNTAFAGNATFTYLSTDAAANQSPAVTYTIPVAKDNDAVYAVITKGGGANKYALNDVIAYGIDPNAASYNSAGLVYNTTTGAPVGGTTSNGIQSGSITAANIATLAAVGVVYNTTTGLFTVSDPTKLPRAGQTIPVTVTTVDQNGGVTTQTVNLVLGANPLPVELSAFTAVAKGQDAQLAWTTASEKNNDRFEVERSLTGTDYVRIGTVRGQGTNSAATAYALTDAGIGQKASGQVYYRLRQVDADGTATYSPVRTLTFSKVAPAISLFPNPATSVTQLDLTALPVGAYQVSVLDAAGRTVLSTTLEAGLAHALDLRNVASGSYTLLVRGQNGGQVVSLTKRLVKE